MRYIPDTLAKIMMLNDMMSDPRSSRANVKPRRKYPFQSTRKDYSKYSFQKVRVTPRKEGDFEGRAWKKASWNQGETNALA